MQVGLDIVTSANCKSQLQFGQDKQLSTLVLNFNFSNFNHQRFWADGILIPNLHKAPLVVRNLYIMQIENLSDIKIADKVIIHFDEYGRTDEDSPFIAAGFNQDAVEEGNHSRTISRVIVLLKDTLKYIEPYNNSSDSYQLTDKGREVKNQGGHFAYKKNNEKKEAANLVRQLRKDEADEFDLKIKKWTYKAKYLPFIFSGLAFLGMVISIIISIKALNSKKDKQDLQPMQQKIQQLQDRVKLQDSLFRVDSLLKRHN